MVKTVMKRNKPLALFFVQNGFMTSFTYLTSGAYLSGLAILMGAGDVLVSYLSVILNISGVMILVLPAFLERFTSRKRMTLVLTALSRLLTVIIAVIPVLVPARLQIAVFIPIVIAAFALQAQTTVVLNQWMLQFMDEKRSGRYIPLRQTLTLIVTVLLSLAGGWWIDFMKKSYTGFLMLFIVAALMGICELVLLARIPDSAPCKPVGRGCRFRDIATLPLKNRQFMSFVLYVLMFYLMLYISDSFTMVYLIKYLALPYRTVTGLSMLISLPQIVLLSVWGKISDRKGHEFVLRTSIWLFAGETLILAFSTPQNWFAVIPAAFLVSSVANAGFAIAVFNRRYELMPQENRIVYDNFYTAAIGIGFILGPMTGGLIRSFLENSLLYSGGLVRGAVEGAVESAGIRLLYIVSTAGILLLQMIYYYVQSKNKHCDLNLSNYTITEP